MQFANPPPIRAVLFDFGGVLASSPFDAFDRYEATHELPPGFIRELNAKDPNDNAWAKLERGEIALEQFAEQFESEAAAAGFELDALEVLSLVRGELRPAMVEAVRRCGERYLTGLVTNNFLRDAGTPALGRDAPTTEVAEVLSLFDAVIESSKVGMRKPEPRVFQLACTTLGVSPSEAVFLDDLGVNLKPARALGMRTIKVVSPSQALADLEATLGHALA